MGAYVLGRKLGEGGMGAVYEATREGSGERVALKRLSGEYALGRFKQELALREILQHPNLLPVLEWGMEGRAPWFTMPLLSGASLGELRRLVSRPWPEGLVLNLAAQALAALEHLHGHGVVHRDVKPSNLFLCDDGTLRLIDYGIARSEDGERTQTTTGQLVGSLRYVSPEQAQGHEIDARTDLFSLGLSLHELLSGERVYRQESNIAVITALLMEQVPSLAELREGLAPDTVSSVAWLLQKTSAARPASVQALRDAWPALREKAWGAEDLRAWLTAALQHRAHLPADPGAAPSTASGTASSTPRPAARAPASAPRSRRAVLLLGTAALATAAAVSWGLSRPGQDAPAQGVTPIEVQAASPPDAGAPDASVEPEPAVPEAPKEPHAPNAGSGYLSLDVRPGWAAVWVDGVKRGDTPLFRLSVKAGAHRVELVRPNGERKRLQLTVKRDRETSRVIRWPTP